MRIFSPVAAPPDPPDVPVAAAAVAVFAAAVFAALSADVVPELDDELVQADRARAAAAITPRVRRTGRRRAERDILGSFTVGGRWAAQGGTDRPGTRPVVGHAVVSRCGSGRPPVAAAARRRR
jgi:hypothetical protein